jgi:uncharacterized protein
MSSDEQIRTILKKYRTIAVYGMSKDPQKVAHHVPMHMREAGYEIIPVNPTVKEIGGMTCYPSLEDVPEHIEILNVFRPSEQTPDVAREAMARKKQRGDISVIWLQEDIKSDEARRLAEEAGITYLEDLCIKKELARLFSGELPWPEKKYPSPPRFCP